MLKRLKIIPSLLWLGVIYTILVLSSIPFILIYIITGKKIKIKMWKIDNLINTLENNLK